MFKCTYNIRPSFISSSVPRIEIKNLRFDPRAVSLTKLEAWDSNEPVRRRVNHGYQRHQMMTVVNAEYSEGLACYIRVADPTSLDYRANMITLQWLYVCVNSNIAIIPVSGVRWEIRLYKPIPQRDIWGFTLCPCYSHIF